MEQEVTPIEVTPTESPAELAGVPDGHIIETPAGEPNEKVVYDRDENGDVIGWHKEIAE